MKKTLILFTSLILLNLSAQKNDKASPDLQKETSLSGLKFRSIGPALTSGRIADIAVNSHNYNEYYVAVASGGVWKTTNNGITYQPVFDSQGSYSIGCVTIDPNNSNTIWVGSGENNNQRSVAFGDGIYRSDDGGQSWKNMGLKSSEHIGMIKVHPENSNIVYVAAYGPLWSAGGDRGIYKSTDQGESWTKILEVSEHTGFNEIHLDPRNSEILYATAHQRRRHVWTYLSGGPESSIYKSTDGGENWQKLENGLPSGDKGRIALAIPPADPDRLYVMIEGHGVYRSFDRGASFNKGADYNTSGNYYVELVPHPHDPEIVYSMDTYMHVSHDAGKTFERVPEKAKHVDNHCLWINPDDTDHMIAGCDGGIYETYDGAGNWHFKPNLPVTQFYRVALDNDTPFYNVYGGTQDNFSLGGPSRTIKRSGIANSDWFVTNTGDGFESQIDPVNPDIVYAQAQYGWLVRYDKKSGESVGIKPFPGKDEPAYRWNWDAPLLISPHDHNRLYFAANKVFRSDDMGNNWKEISPDLTQQIDRHKLPVMGKTWSVDAISYDRSTSNYGNIVALDESPLKEGLLYIGTDDGLIQVTEDGGQNWTKYTSFPGIPQNTYVNTLVASQYDENVVFAVFNNHKNGDFKPYILKSSDKGKTWQSISGNLPERGSVFCLKQDHLKRDLLFAGTEFGVFFSNDGGSNWKQLKSGLPTIAIRDLEIQKRENDLVLASFGRGFYILDNYTPLRDYNTAVLEKEAHLFPVKDALVYMQSQPLGYRKVGFQGASYYTAENPPMGATFTYYIKGAPKSLKEQRQEKEKDAVDVVYPSAEELRAEDREEEPYLFFLIKNSIGQEVSRFTKAPAAGINRVSWNGHFSSTSYNRTADDPITKADEANLAPPGEYTVEIFMSKDGNISPLAVPRIFRLNWLDNNTFKADDLEALLAFQADIQNTHRKLVAAKNFFDELDKKIDQLKANARNTPGADLSLLDTLRSLEYEMYNLKIKLDGDNSLSSRNFDTPPSLRDRVDLAMYNSFETTTAPTGSQQKNLSIAKEELSVMLSSLQKIAGEAESINQILQAAGAPYLKGDLPDTRD